MNRALSSLKGEVVLQLLSIEGAKAHRFRWAFLYPLFTGLFLLISYPTLDTFVRIFTNYNFTYFNSEDLNLADIWQLMVNRFYLI